MKFMRNTLLASLVLAVLWPAAVMAITDEEVAAAIEQMKKFLYSQQDPKTGGWDQGVAPGQHEASQATGRTALVLQALLSAGESEHHPQIAKGLKYLAENESNGTYAVGLRAHVWAQLPPRYGKLLQNEADWLKRAQNGSLFDYGNYRGDRVDHSVTQYGVLGLWEYVKRGGQMPAAFWETLIRHFLATQNSDGGWAYSSTGPSTGSMTTAGLTMLYIAQQQVRRDLNKADPAITEAINRGLKWLDERFDGGSNPGSGAWNTYWLYGLERVALASGVKMLNNRDWFETGATYLLRAKQANGSVGGNVVDTAFALGFLSRGRVPVWVSKIAIPGANWNNRPNDIYFLTQYLSDQFEREINWQVLSIDHPVEMWRSAPVAYISTDTKLELTDKQKTNLKRYIDLGGTVLVNSEGGRAAAISFESLMKELYPNLKMRRLERNHILYEVHHKLNQTPVGGATVSAISNGAREIAIVFDSDVGMSLQADDPPGTKPAWRIATNVFVLVTDRRTLNNRLVDAFESRRRGVTATRTITIGHARHSGAWNVEPGAMEMLGNHLFNRAAVELKVEDIDLAAIGDSDLKLIILNGVEDITLSDDELAAIEKYVDKGGTLFIETVGGQGGFTRGIEGRLNALFKTNAVRLDPTDSIISGQNLVGGYNVSEVSYTRFFMSQMNVGNRPRLTAYYRNDRPAVILSSDDLSLGLLNVRHWGIFGYDHESARRIMTNLVLATNR